MGARLVCFQTRQAFLSRTALCMIAYIFGMQISDRIKAKASHQRETEIVPRECELVLHAPLWALSLETEKQKAVSIGADHCHFANVAPGQSVRHTRPCRTIVHHDPPLRLGCRSPPVLPPDGAVGPDDVPVSSIPLSLILRFVSSIARRLKSSGDVFVAGSAVSRGATTSGEDGVGTGYSFVPSFREVEDEAEG